jgi:hypothetical protein
MPQSFHADIEWHETRIAFYEQALKELDAMADTPQRAIRQNGVRKIIADFRRTTADLKELATRA